MHKHQDLGYPTKKNKNKIVAFSKWVDGFWRESRMVLDYGGNMIPALN